MGRVSKERWGQTSLRTEEIEVPELGGSVLIRELPSDVAAGLQGLVDVVTIGREQRAKVAVAEMEAREFAYGVVGDDDEPLFTVDEVKEIQHRHGKAFRTVVDAIDRLSGLDKKSIEEAEARFPSSGAEPNGSALGVAGGGNSESDVAARAGARAGAVGAADADGPTGDAAP